MSSQLTIMGMPELVSAIKKLPNEMKTKVIRPALLKASNVVVNAEKAAAPMGKKTMKRGKGTTSPGELKRNIWRIIKTKDSDIVSFIGPNRKKGSKAFYSHMVIAGTKRHLIKGPISLNKKMYSNVNHPGAKKDDFIQRSWNSSSSQAYEVLKNQILSNLNKLGFNS